MLLSCLFVISCTNKVTPTLEPEKEPQEQGIPDAEIKIPPGVEKPNYGIIEPTPKTVNQSRVDPPFWWVGMYNPEIQVMIHDNIIGDYTVTVDHPGVTLTKVNKVENPNYLFIDLTISNVAKTGKFPIKLTRNGTTKEYPFELRQRYRTTNRIQGISDKDFVYLLMPDRFSNGDPSNDIVPGMYQDQINRDRMYYRHGGDLQGIINHLDYLKDLGVTALWINPVQENDQPYESYHGYAITDHYMIDRRFGTNKLYKELVDKCHDMGIKVVMDIIHNHVGDKHFFIQDLPSKDWIHQYSAFTRTTYRAPTLMDPYASEADKERMSDAWFDYHMPDLNQKNPLLGKYLTQNNIWWIEFSGIDSYRVDTYAYPDQEYMAEWAKAILQEYPNFHMFAETWVHGSPIQAQFTQNNNLREGYNSNMPAVTDFQLYYAINEALDRNQGWTEGIARVYFTLAKDFLYEDPTRNVVFLDNHDLSRFYSMIKENDDKFKSGISFLLTTRGIPMMYYGTEILLKNYSDPDGKVRQDFPGGWTGDVSNKFTSAGRSEKENETFEFVKKLANYRKNNEVLQTGRLTQFVPEDGVYTYFRHNQQKTVMVMMNTHNNIANVALDRFQERLSTFSKGENIVSGEVFDLGKEMVLPPNQTVILELKK